jgi:hypothetical protein
MSWGYKILIVIVLFIGGMLYMVYVAMQQDNQMLDDRYYERELHYQSQIDASRRLTDISAERLLTQDDSQIILSIPASVAFPMESGAMEWIRRDNNQLDKNLPIAVDSLGIMQMDKADFEKGMYMVRIRWEYRGEAYFAEEDFFVIK